MKLEFKNWTETMNNPVLAKKRLVVYDFDGTIANVPERPKSWEGSDWWGHPDSLSAPHYQGTVNQEVVDAFRQDQSDPETHVILLTGRRGVISPQVRQVLKSQGLFGRRMIPDSNKGVLDKYKQVLANGHDALHPDEHVGHEEYYSGDHSTEADYPKTAKGKPDGTTLAHKMYIIQSKMVHPGTEVVEFWDDRDDHMPHFIKCGLDLLKQYGEQQGGKLKSVTLHRVFAPYDLNGQATIQHIPIKLGMHY